MTNPFAVQTPEGISADDVVSLFVNVFGDFNNIPKPGNTFLHGHRGSGKSMMFRYLEPDCQQRVNKCSIEDLEFFGVYVPIKNTELNLTELKRLENMHANLVLNEHFLALYVAIRIFTSLTKASVPDPREEHARSLVAMYNKEVKPSLVRAGWLDPPDLHQRESLDQHFRALERMFSNQYVSVLMYVRRLAFASGPVPYLGPLVGYLDFLFPLMKAIRALPFMPPGPVFLLMDDADNLSHTQTSILNSWVSCRTTSEVSLKISTQLNYKTYLTSAGRTIDTPHDFSEVNISAVYTSRKKATYYRRVSEIVLKRLELNGITSTPSEFFPPAEEQELKIREIAQDLKAKWPEEGRGFRPTDDMVRYARPQYMTGLRGTSKSGSTYKYAGFDQLVHISSGIVRYFLESASLMYGEMRSLPGSESISAISPEVQDRVVRQQADEFLFSEFDRWSTDEASRDEPGSPRTIDRTRRLRDLIQALGGTFRRILESDASERRVFSVALTDEPSPDILEVLDLGVQYGYFHQSTIGNEEGTGRTRLYILTRRLAPHFGLDPTSFAGYKFVTNEALREACQKPKTFLGKVRSSGVDPPLEAGQLALFEED